MTKAELESWLGTLDIWLVVFGIVVAVGVGGEAVAGFLHWRWGNKLRDIQAAENLALQSDIEKFKKDSATLSAEAESARAAIADANARAAEANTAGERSRSCSFKT